MREILDNARYAPTVGRYKVYLIDEVHMLSKGAFNSMLKTLEEPPDHVKFVLATTDPQKIPVTVLSRCLQFNLTPLPRAAIADRLAHILAAESIVHDESALPLLAAAAQGSLRDALSLLDQAIAYGGGEVREPGVRAMLGVVDRGYLFRIVDALLAGDGPALLREADALGAAGQAFAPALDELASIFYRIAVAQAVPDADGADDAERIRDYAGRMTPEAVQLGYQISAQGRADLALAPDEATGFAMTLLRLLAFEPATSLDAGGQTSRETSPGKPVARTRGETRPAAPQEALPRTSSSDDARTNVALVKSASAQRARPLDSPAASNAGRSGENAVSSGSPPAAPVPRQALPEAIEEWPAFVAQLKLTGMAAQLAAQSELKSIKGSALSLAIPASQKHLADKAYADKLKAALDAATGRKLLLAFEIGETSDSSLAALERRQRAKAKAEGEAAFRNEPFVRDLVERFQATVRTDTIAPLPDSPSSPKQEPR
jgi:DNA polymerase-3 subunit gamma/tau